jgi:hypothetical protein
MMATTTLSLALRATTSGRTVLIALCAGRSGPRERWSDGQSENDGSDEDGLAKNLASGRVCEL